MIHRHIKLLSPIEPNFIVIAESVTASDIVLFSRRGILGVGMEFGGPTSHVALMARALDVPAVVSLHDVVDYEIGRASCRERGERVGVGVFGEREWRVGEGGG